MVIVKYSSKEIELKGERMLLHPLKGMFWPKRSILVISDVHIGKSGHFRKNGIPVPMKANQHNYWNLDIMITQLKPKTLLFLGDITHSAYNEEWPEFCDYLDVHPEIDRLLVKGNHDILGDVYQNSGFKVVDELKLDPFHFVHDSEEFPQNDLYMIQGHIHPAIRLKGTAHQSIKVPCFHFEKEKGTMPAFGNFTGYGKIRAKKSDDIYIIAEQKVLLLS